MRRVDPCVNLPHPRDLLPHADPMVLLDAVVFHEGPVTRATTTIRADDRFLGADGTVSSVVGVELIAQCVACHAGLRRRLAGLPTEIGLLVSCRQLTLEIDAFEVGETLDIESTLVWGGDEMLGTFDGAIRRGDVVVARGRLNVVRGVPRQVLEGEPAPEESL